MISCKASKKLRISHQLGISNLDFVGVLNIMIKKKNSILSFEFSKISIHIYTILE